MILWPTVPLMLVAVIYSLDSSQHSQGAEANAGLKLL